MQGRCTEIRIENHMGFFRVELLGMMSRMATIAASALLAGQVSNLKLRPEK